MPRQRTPILAGRSTGDLLVLIICMTICFAVIAGGAAVFLLSLRQPDRDVSAAFNTISDVINTLIGLLAGFLAGRTDAHLTIQRGADGSRSIEAEGARSNETTQNLQRLDDVESDVG